MNWVQRLIPEANWMEREPHGQEVANYLDLVVDRESALCKVAQESRTWGVNLSQKSSAGWNIRSQVFRHRIGAATFHLIQEMLKIKRDVDTLPRIRGR